MSAQGRVPREGRGEERAAKVSLARALSKLGYASRSEAKEIVEAGRVTVSGRLVRDPEERVDPARDRIAVDGKVVRAGKRIYIALHKPRGYVTTASDERDRPTVFACFEGLDLPRIVPVGRLDMESEGLLLFTNDTRWAQRVLDPGHNADRVYEVKVRGVPAEDVLERLRAGIMDRKERLELKSVRPLRREDQDQWLEIVLDEGRNRHIRRMLAAVDLEVLRLVRTAIGPVQLEKLPPGASRELTPLEAKTLTGEATERVGSRAARPAPAPGQGGPAPAGGGRRGGAGRPGPGSQDRRRPDGRRSGGGRRGT
jgi:23S rRNA pseudouridine2605 synthase